MRLLATSAAEPDQGFIELVHYQYSRNVSLMLEEAVTRCQAYLHHLIAINLIPHLDLH